MNGTYKLVAYDATRNRVWETHLKDCSFGTARQWSRIYLKRLRSCHFKAVKVEVQTPIQNL